MALSHQQSVDKKVKAGGTGTFALSVKKWAQKTGIDIETVKKKLAFDIAVRLIMRTPVDTGRARANWMMSIGSADLTTTDDTDKAGRSTYSHMSQVLQSTDSKDSSIFITNSLPYIARLEYGYSQQAPEGMVRLTLAEFSRLTDGAIRFVKSTSGTGRIE